MKQEQTMRSLVSNLVALFPQVLILLLILLALGGSSCTEPQIKAPNVIVILTDDQGWGDVSFNGNSNLSTPNIDKIAAQGASLTNFYVCAVCSPTRAEFLTGRYNFRCGIYSTGGGGERMDLDELTIAEVFRNAGYATAAYGKWHNGMQYPYHPNGRGFEDFYGFCSGHWGNYFSPMLEHNGRIVKGNGFVIDDFTDHGLTFMEKNQNNPFFLYLPYNTPHTPFQVPERNWNNHRNKEINMRSVHGGENLDETRAALAMCENIDDNIGRILDKTVDLGIEENTIVLFFCDNGPNRYRWNGGMKGRKGSTDEGGLRSPLFVKWPGGIESGMEIARLSSVTDLLPTLVELCGIEFEEKHPLDGISLAQTLLGEENEWPDRYILNNWKDQFSIRSQDYRLDRHGSLYNITGDRGQTQDLSGELPGIREEMLKAVDHFRQQRLNELPETDNRPIVLGHPGLKYTQLPARDGTAHGGIQRSNRWPNCSFFSNWTNLEDSITWQVNIPEPGTFRVQLYYTCKEPDTGSTIRLGIGESTLDFRVVDAHDPPLRGMEHDLTPRIESYVKDWKVADMGQIAIMGGNALMSLKALEIPGGSVIDFRLLLFERLGNEGK